MYMDTDMLFPIITAVVVLVIEIWQAKRQEAAQLQFQEELHKRDMAMSEYKADMTITFKDVEVALHDFSSSLASTKSDVEALRGEVEELTELVAEMPQTTEEP